MEVFQVESNVIRLPVEPSRNVVVLLILAVGLTLRLYELDSGLWHDEILTYVKFASMPVGEILTTYDSQNQNFLYSLLVRACFYIFGEGAWSLRLPAVIFGVGSLWALYFFGRQVGSVCEALLTTGLLTFSYHHVWFSQNARGYTGLLFWTLLASGLFLQALREGQPRLWYLYAATAALGIYTQMLMLFVIAGHFITYLVTLFARRKEIWPDRGAGFLIGFCLAGFFTLLLYAPVLPQVFGTLVGQESTVPAWKSPVWTFLELFRGMRIGFVHGTAASIALAIFGLGVWSFARTNPAFILLLFIPPLLCAGVNIAMGHHLWPRFFFFTVGFGAFAVVRGTMQVGDLLSNRLLNAPSKSVLVGTVLCVGLILISAASVPLAYAPKQDFRGALEFVQSRTEPGDAVVTVGLATFTYETLYKTNWQAVETLEALNAIRVRAKQTWLIYTFPTHLRAVHPEIMSTVQRDFRVVRQFRGTVGDGTIFVARSNGRPS